MKKQKQEDNCGKEANLVWNWIAKTSATPSLLGKLPKDLACGMISLVREATIREVDTETIEVRGVMVTKKEYYNALQKFIDDKNIAVECWQCRECHKVILSAAYYSEDPGCKECIFDVDVGGLNTCTKCMKVEHKCSMCYRWLCEVHYAKNIVRCDCCDYSVILCVNCRERHNISSFLNDTYTFNQNHVWSVWSDGFKLSCHNEKYLFDKYMSLFETSHVKSNEK